jgi:vacuolar protein sorting-associated protein 1
VVRIELDQIRVSALHVVYKTLQLEHDPVYTQNTDYFASEKRKWSDFYTGVRRRSHRFLTKRAITKAGESDDEEGTDDSETIAEDKFQQALSVMANVRAYFQVAVKVSVSKTRVARD